MVEMGITVGCPIAFPFLPFLPFPFFPLGSVKTAKGVKPGPYVALVSRNLEKEKKKNGL